jgi:hypothetical protein
VNLKEGLGGRTWRVPSAGVTVGAALMEVATAREMRRIARGECMVECGEERSVWVIDSCKSKCREGVVRFRSLCRL